MQMSPPPLDPDVPSGPLGEARRFKLLVVDDQAVNIQALYRTFAGDYQVFMATSGEQALALCRDKLPDLVLLDVMMPGLDGYEVCTQLKGDNATRDIPVIFVTAHDDEAAETRGLAVGAVDFISKPINPVVVRARVKTHLTLKHQSDLLRQMAFLDGLTGLFNRRYFDERWASECARSQRSGAPISLALIDVDHFKRFNDHYGHQTGDDCLRQVAAALRRGLMRPGDIVTRYGGEEFACILCDTDAAGALDVGARLEREIRGLKVSHADSPVSPVVTVSVGLATRDAMQSGTASEVLALADEQLYLAKAGGRARACGARLHSSVPALPRVLS